MSLYNCINCIQNSDSYNEKVCNFHKVLQYLVLEIVQSNIQFYVAFVKPCYF